MAAHFLQLNSLKFTFLMRNRKIMCKQKTNSNRIQKQQMENILTAKRTKKFFFFFLKTTTREKETRKPSNRLNILYFNETEFTNMNENINDDIISRNRRVRDAKMFGFVFVGFFSFFFQRLLQNLIQCQ